MSILTQSPMAQLSGCNHADCQWLRTQNVANSANIVPVNHYFNHQNHTHTWVVLAGLEAGGQYVGQLNLIGGKMDARDHGCFLACARREFREETGMDIPLAQFINMVHDAQGNLLCHIQRSRPHAKGTPVFFFRVVGWSRATLNQQLKAAGDGEMRALDWVRLDGSGQLDSQMGHLPISSYLLSALQAIAPQVPRL
jgi:8-oxo-dGTP pyrophosphatase MutT (NUDIX family)